MSYAQKALTMQGGRDPVRFVRNLMELLERRWNGSGRQEAIDFCVWVFEREWS
jgi:hypothetical protein